MPLMFALVLVLGPEPELAPAEAAPSYADAVARLAEADTQANLDPAASTQDLAAALASLVDFAPQLAADPDTQKLRQLARLNLARAYLFAEQPQLAAETMDEALREAMGTQIPVQLFGDSLEQLHARRREQLESLGTASIVVSCEYTCKIYIDELEVDPDQPPQLLLGTYRLWIEDARGKLPIERQLVELSEAGTSYEVMYGQPKDPPPPCVELPPVSGPRRLKLGPLGLSGVVTLAAGAATLGAGALFGTLPGGLYYVQPDPQRVGMALLGVGAAATLVGTTMILVDTLALERRRKRRALRAHAAVSPAGAGLWLSGRF